MKSSVHMGLVADTLYVCFIHLKEIKWLDYSLIFKPRLKKKLINLISVIENITAVKLIYFWYLDS